MISGRATTDDTPFSRPKPARAGRRSHGISAFQNLDYAPPPPYDSPMENRTSLSTSTSGGADSDKEYSSSSSSGLHDSPRELNDQDRQRLINNAATIVSRAGSAIFSSTSHSRPNSPPPSGARTPPDRLHAIREHAVVPATPQRLALLSEMNAELQERIDQLNEQMEQESIASSSKLRKLEKEIIGLRSELEYTQQRNEELEDVVKREEEEEEQTARQIRRERHEKLKAARQRRLTHGVGISSAAITDTTVDFAPAPTRSMVHAPSSTVPRGEPVERASTPVDKREADVSRSSTLVESPSATISGFPLVDVDPSFSLLSTMQSKITELEHATLKFREQKAQTERNVQKMMQEMQASSGRSASARLLEAVAAATPSTSNTILPNTSLSLRPNEVNEGVSPPVKDPGHRIVDDLAVDGFSTSHPGALRGRTSRGSLRVKKKTSAANTTGRRVGLGNKSMLASSTSPMPAKTVGKGKGKGKSRAPITPLSFVSPASGAEERLPNNKEPVQSTSSVAFPAPQAQHSARSTLELPSFSFPSSLSGPLDGHEDIFKSPLHDFSFSHSPIVGTSSAEGRNRHRTLKSELGAEFGDDWRAEFEHHMFGSDLDDEDISVSQVDDEHNEESSTPIEHKDDASSIAMSALSAALDPMHLGEARNIDEHILPLNSLRSAPIETFYLLDRAVNARPAAWISARAQDKDHKLLMPAEERLRLPTGRLRDDTWNAYPDEDEEEEEGDDGDDPAHPPSRRERALSRMTQVHQRRISTYTNPPLLPDPILRPSLVEDRFVTPAQDPVQEHSQVDNLDLEESDDERDSRRFRVENAGHSRRSRAKAETPQDSNRYDTNALATKLQSVPSLQTFVQIWMMLQFVVVLIVFVYFAARRGPTAILSGRGTGSGARSSRGVITRRRW